MVNWRSDVNTPLRLNGLTMRSESTPSMASRSTMPSGMGDDRAEPYALGHQVGSARPCPSRRLPRSPRRGSPAGRRSSRAPEARPGPRPSARSCAARSRTRGRWSRTGRSRTLPTRTHWRHRRPSRRSTGSLWQPKQEFESGPLVRLNGGLTPFLRLVGMIACVAFGRPAPSTVVNFALNSTRPRSMRAGRADGPAAAIALKSRCEPGSKTRSSQLPPNATPAAARAAPNAKTTPGLRFISLAPRRPRAADR